MDRANPTVQASLEITNHREKTHRRIRSCRLTRFSKGILIIDVLYVAFLLAGALFLCERGQTTGAALAFGTAIVLMYLALWCARYHGTMEQQPLKQFLDVLFALFNRSRIKSD
jgi:hypothetical protein